MPAYLDVPFSDKDAAKAAGARWDPRARRWYAPHGLTPDLMSWRAADTPLPDALQPSLARTLDRAIGWCRQCGTYQQRRDTPVNYVPAARAVRDDAPGEWLHCCATCGAAWDDGTFGPLRPCELLHPAPEQPWGWWAVAVCAIEHQARLEAHDHRSCDCTRGYEYLGVPVTHRGHYGGHETDFRFDYLVYVTVANVPLALNLSAGSSAQPAAPHPALLEAATNTSGHARRREPNSEYQRLTSWSDSQLATVRRIPDIRARNESQS